MCMWFWGYPPIITIKIDTMWAQFLLTFPLIIWKLYILVLHGLKMCMWLGGYPAFIFSTLRTFSTYFFFFFSCDRLTWETRGRNSSFSFTPNFLKLCKSFCHDLKMCMYFWGYPSLPHFTPPHPPPPPPPPPRQSFFINFFRFRRCFSGLISIRIDTLWVQLNLVFHPSFLNYAYLFYMV